MSRNRGPRRPKVVPQAPGVRPPAAPWVHWLVPLLIALVTVAAFLPAMENEFVDWDDDHNLVNNAHYRGLGWPQLRWMWTTFHMGHYIPLTWMTLGLDYLLWGLQPVGYHLSSLLLHAANAAVFYLVVRRLLSTALPGSSDHCPAGLAVSAAFAALLFALHPLRVESVAWATERRDVLSGLFYLLTILAYLRACERGERGRGWYWGAAGLFACALLSKSIAVSVPVVLLILDVYPLRRLGGATGWWGPAARRVYLEKIPLLVLALAASAVAFLALARLHNMASLDELTMLGRLAISAYGLSFYLWKTIAPVNLAAIYPLPAEVNLSAPAFFLSYSVVVAITALAWTLRRRVPGLAAAWLAYVVILLPVLGIFQNGPQIAADRYTYLATLGWAILASAGLLAWWPRLPSLLTGAALGVLLGLAALTWKQLHVWHDSEKLWIHTLAIAPNSPIAENQFGVALARRGRPVEAIEHYRRALQMWPAFAKAHYNWGTALAQQGQPAEAIEHFQQALRLKPDYAEAHSNWGAALARQGKLAEAIEHYQRALSLEPDLAEAHYNWGTALARQGQPAEAIEHFQQALRLKPNYAEAHNNWGATLADQGQLAEAIEHYQQALLVKPDHADAHNNWGVALGRQSRLTEAIEHFQQALRLKPDHADAHINWGLALAQQGRRLEAIEHFQQALRLKPDLAAARSDLTDVLRGPQHGQGGPGREQLGQEGGKGPARATPPQ
jgi:tetratricopeptide (TPR) repeat protein